MNLFTNSNNQTPTRNLFANNQSNTSQQSSQNNQAQSQPNSQMKNENKQMNNKSEQGNNSQTINNNNSYQQMNNKVSLNISNFDNEKLEQYQIWFRKIEGNLDKYKNIYQMRLNNVIYKTAFSLGLTYFQPRQSEKQRFQKFHRNKQNFGWKKTVMGKVDPNVFPRQSQNISKIWALIITELKQLFNINEMLLCQYLQIFLIKQAIYQKQIFIQYFNNGGYIWVLNQITLNQLFINQTTINFSSHLFSRIIKAVLKQYICELTAMLNIIQILMHQKQKSKRQYYEQVIRKSEAQVVTVLWDKFKQFCYLCTEKIDSQNKLKSQIEKRRNLFINVIDKSIEKIIKNYQQQIMMNILTIMRSIIGRDTSWFKSPKRNKIINIVEVIRFMGDNFTEFLNNQTTHQKYQQFLRNGLNFLLKVFPFPYFYKKLQNQHNFDKKTAQEIKTILSQNHSILLIPFSILFKSIEAHSFTNRRKQQHLQLTKIWIDIPKQILWLMRDQKGWQEWLAIFFQQADIKQIFDDEDILFHIVKMCKKSVSSNQSNFWISSPNYQIIAIRDFLQNCLTNFGIKQILPILTKSIRRDPNQIFFDFVGFDLIRQIRNQIFQNLIVSNKSPTAISSHRQNQRQSFTLSIQRYPQQELKFICQLIESFQYDLPFLQSKLFQCSQGTGILICNMLFQWLYKIKQYNISALKCIRYILRSIDFLFNCQTSRASLLIGLSLSTFRKDQNYLQDMISLACTKQSFSQQYRQSQKLRQILSHHLCNILTHSTYISQYFPIECSATAENLYYQAQAYLMNQNYEMLKQWFFDHVQIDSFHSSLWFGTLLLILQSDQLYPKDFESIRLLIQKLKMQTKNWKQQRDCIIFIKKVLDKANIFTQIKNNFQPILKHQVSSQGYHNKSPYGLQNLKLITSIDSIQKVRLRTKIDQSYRKRRRKIDSAEQEAHTNVLGNIAGSLEIIGTLLKISLTQNTYPMIADLELYQDTVKYLCNNEQIFHYSVNINRGDEKSYNMSHNNNNFYSENSPNFQFVLKHTYQINIIQVIANFINFQQHHSIKRKKHKNKMATYPHYLQISDDLLEQNAKIPSVIASSDLLHNVLGSGQNSLYPYDPDFSIGIRGVLQIIGILLQKGKGNMIYNCLINHDCKIINQIGQDSLIGSKDQFKQFLRQIIQNNINSAHINKRLPIIFQFLTTAMCSSAFFAKQIIINFLKDMGSPVRTFISSISKPDHLYLLNKITLFIISLQYHHVSYPQQIDSFLKYPENLINQIVNKLFKMRQIQPISSKLYGKNDTLLSLKLQYNLALHLLYKGTIGILIQISKNYLLKQSSLICQQIFQKLLEMSSQILAQPPPKSRQLIDRIQLIPMNYIGVEDYNQITMLTYQLNKNCNYFGGFYCIEPFLPFFQNFQCSYGREFQYNPIMAMPKLLNMKNYLPKSTAMSSILQIYTINFVQSSEFCSQLVINNLFTFISVVLGVGDYGYLLQGNMEDKIIYQTFKSNKILNTRMDKLIHSLFKQFKYRNTDNSYQNVFGKSGYHKLVNLIKLSRIMIQYLQKNPNWHHNNDFILIIQSQIIINISCLFQKQQDFTKSQYCEYSKLITYLLCSTNQSFNLSNKVYLLFLYACTIGYQTNLTTYNSQELLNICLKVQSLMIPQINNKKKIRDQPKINTDEQSIVNSIFLATSVLSQIIHPYQYSYSTYMEDLNRKQTLQVISFICINLVNKRLQNMQTLDLNLIGILNLINSLLYQVEQITKNMSQSSDRGFLDHLIRQFYLNYARYLYKLALKSFKHEIEIDSQLQIIIAESFRTVYSTYDLFDINSQQIVFSYAQILIKKSTPFDNKSSKKQSLSSQGIHRLNNLLNDVTINNTSHIGLFQLLQIKQYLGLVHLLCSQKQNWSAVSYTKILQSIFQCLLNQKQINLMLHNHKVDNRIKSTFKIIPKLPIQRILNNISLTFDNASNQQIKNEQRKIFHQSPYKKQDTNTRTQPLDLLDFAAHYQILTILYHYMQSINYCVKSSPDLKNFCANILTQDTNHLDETIWEKLCEFLYLAMDFLAYNFFEPIKYQPQYLSNCLILYHLSINSTDIAYETDFVTSHFEKIYQKPGKSILTGLQITLAGIGFSLLELSQNIVQIWQSTDWKQNICWKQTRRNLLKKLKDWQKYFNQVIVANLQDEHEQKQIEQFNKWIFKKQAEEYENRF